MSAHRIALIKRKTMSSQKRGEYLYSNISQARANAIIDALRKSGTSVTGENPWNIDIPSGGITLKCTWNSETLTLSIVVKSLVRDNQMCEYV
jgi:hypothetical protein